MKTKTLLITVAVTAITGTGVYFAVTGDKAEATAENGFIPAVDTARPQAVRPSDKKGSTESPAVVDGKPETEGLEQPSDTPAAVEAEAAPALDTLNIDPAHLKQAEQMAGMIKMAADMMDNDMVQNALASQIKNPSRKLQLRLSLDPDTAALFDEVLSSHTAAETKRVQDAANSTMKIMGELIETDRENMVNFLALQSMQRAKVPLDAAQQEFFQEYAMKMAKTEGFGDIKKLNGKAREWYEADEVLASLNEGLPVEQQTALAEYVDEQIKRKKEEKAYKRTNKLANTLGLNEADRTALYEYLYENPAASDDDITAQLSPELRELMSGKDHQGFGVQTIDQ